MDAKIQRELGRPSAAVGGRWIRLWAFGLLLAATGRPTCYAVEKLGMAPYHAALEQASAGDRLQITTLLTEVANAHGMKKGDPLPGTLATFHSPPSALGLAISAGDPAGSGTVHITIGPVGLGIKLNEERRAVIAAVDAGLRRAFGERLKGRPGSKN